MSESDGEGDAVKNMVADIMKGHPLTQKIRRRNIIRGLAIIGKRVLIPIMVIAILAAVGKYLFF